MMTNDGARIAFADLKKGDRLGPIPFEVSAAEVLDYLDSTGEAPELWSEAVPPLALGARALALVLERIDIAAGLLHTGQEYDFRRLVRHGEPLELIVDVTSRADRRGAIMLVLTTAWGAPGGEIAGVGRTSVLAPPEEQAGE